MTSIHTLVPDIQETISKKDGWFTTELANSLATDISLRLQEHLGEKKQKPRLRLSGMGPKCPKQLWHSIHTPELAEPLSPSAELKYSYGHVLEALLVTLAKASGHEVTGEQDEVIADGITGHRDCIIDGCIVDVKSASSLSYLKFKSGSIGQNDDFGYLDQLDGYLLASVQDNLVRVKDRAYLLAIDKTLGHICLYEHQFRERSIRERISKYKQIVALGSPPQCECETINEGEAGNVRLDTRASYSPFKYCCCPSLRTFLYSNGPRYLTKVVKRPWNKDGPITEVDKFGKIVYN